MVLTIAPAEARRLAALGEYGIQEALAEPGFDRLVQLASNVFDVPIALISLVESHRQLFAARVGLDVCETARDVSFFGVAFDDYGTGYASLSMLKRYPLTRLKVDQTFVRNMCDSLADAAIIRAILFLGRSFGLEVIAEGIETEEQLGRLRKKGCEEGQGYLFGKPMPASEFSRRLSLTGVHDNRPRRQSV